MATERFGSMPMHAKTPGKLSPFVIAIGGGKGGIGKTVISACLAMALAELEREVVLIDGDLGGSNLNTTMGMYMPSKTIFDFFTRKVAALSEIAMDTPFPRLKMIAGAPGSLGIANIKYWEKRKIMRHITQLEADYVVVDLGAGMSFNEIDFFNLAHTGIVVANPEPPAIQECYNFIKVSLLRKLRTLFSGNDFVLDVLNAQNGSAYTNETRLVSELVADVAASDADTGSQFQIIVDDFNPHLLLNDVYDDKEKMEGMAIKLAAHDLLGIDVEFMGMIPHSAKIRDAIQQMHLADLYENNMAVRLKVLEIARKYFVLSRQGIT